MPDASRCFKARCVFVLSQNASNNKSATSCDHKKMEAIWITTSKKVKTFSRLELCPKHQLAMALLNLTTNQKLIIFNYVQCNYNQKSPKKCCDDA